jgi:hypothetical protein
MLWAFLVIEVCQQHDPGIGKRLNDILPHDRLAKPEINGAIDTHGISTN